MAGVTSHHGSPSSDDLPIGAPWLVGANQLQEARLQGLEKIVKEEPKLQSVGRSLREALLPELACDGC